MTTKLPTGLESDINVALLRLKNEGKLLHWREYQYPDWPSTQPSFSVNLSIRYSDSDEEISDENLIIFFTDAQIKFIQNIRKAATANEKELTNILQYTESLEERDLGLSEFENDEIIVEFSVNEDSDFDLGLLSFEGDPFHNPKYLILSAIAVNPSLEFQLAEKMCASYPIQDSFEESPCGLIALGFIANPKLSSLHRSIIETFVHNLTNYWGNLKRAILTSSHISSEDLDDVGMFYEIYSYDMGRIIEGFDDLYHYEWDMMRDSKEADHPEFIPLYNAAYLAPNTKSGVALLDDNSERLVYFGEIQDSYKCSFKVDAYSDYSSKILIPVLKTAGIKLDKYSVNDIYDLFGGTSQANWDYLVEELDVRTLESLVSFGDQDLVKAILGNQSLPKELRALALLQKV